MEVWCRLLHPRECCLPGPWAAARVSGFLEVCVFEQWAPVPPRAPDPAAEEGKVDAKLKSGWSVTSAW